MAWKGIDQTHSKSYDIKKGKVKKKGALKKTKARIAQDYARNAEADGDTSAGRYEAKEAEIEAAKKTGGVLKRGNILQHMHGSKHASPLKQTPQELKQASGYEGTYKLSGQLKTLDPTFGLSSKRTEQTMSHPQVVSALSNIPEFGEYLKNNPREEMFTQSMKKAKAKTFGLKKGPLKQTQKEMDQLKSSPSRSQSKKYKKLFFDPYDEATKEIYKSKKSKAKEKVTKLIETGGQGSQTFGL